MVSEKFRVRYGESNYRKSGKNHVKTRYLGRIDFEATRAGYGRTCLRVASDLLDTKVRKGGAVRGSFVDEKRSGGALRKWKFLGNVNLISGP